MSTHGVPVALRDDATTIPHTIDATPAQMIALFSRPM